MQSLNNMNVHVNVYITTLYLLIVICANGINCFQRFLEQPKYTEVNPGQDALLTCKVIDKRGTCSWQKDNKPVGIYAKKYEWAARPSSGNVALHLDLHPPPMQIGGDCSLWIRSATLDFDDGLWECQVTASDFTTQDALTSHPVRLVVRVAPQRPRLEYEGIHVPPGQNITADSFALTTVKCVSHYGNPPATLKWYLGEQELEPIHPQINNTEPDNPRTWSTTSVVQLTAMRERHGDILRCLAYHESYAAQTMSVEARLDVKYAPIIRLIGSPEHDLEEDRDALILRCVADANPPASIVWRRAGRSEIASLQETLQLRPVGRRDAGLYTCQAQNSVGTSEQLSVQLDVKYPPKIISAGPDRLTTAPLFSPAAFECIADGNPMPTYKWVQRISHGSTKFIERGQEPRLVIDNITYDHQGEYECRATSYINGQERVAVSEPVSLQVVGAPQVLRLHPSLHTVVVKRDEPASLTLVVCADPRPIRVAWEWGSLRLDAGTGIERFHADDMVPDSREDCFLSTLHIDHATEHDSRPYYLVVENERGLDRLAMHLNVDEPLEMSYLLGIACGCLAAVLILICLCIYAVRSKKCCFKGTSGYKSSDKDSEKADLKSRSNSTSAGTGPSTSTQADGVYTNPSVGFLSPTTASTLTQSHQPYASGLSSLGGLGVRDVSSLVGHHHGASSSPEAMKCTRAKTITTRRKSTAMQYNPSNLNMIDNMQSTEHLLWQEEANEFIKRYPQQRHSSSGISNKNNNNNCNKDAKQQEQFNRHSMNSGLVYTHPSAIAMMTLSKSGSDACLADADADDDAGLVGGMIVGNVVGNELLTARQRHQRDLFSGDLGIPPIPPPPPRTSFGQSQPLPHIAPRKRTHVGNVVHTFEAIALQRRLAAFKQQQLQQQQKSKQQQQQPSQQTFSKYFKSNNKFCKFKRQQQQQQQLKARIAHTEIKCNTFNERNKQIAQHYLNQMELDYRKNLFSSQMHTNVVNCNNNNNKHKIGANEQAEVGVVAVFDEMLAGYSATDDDDVANDNDVQITQNSTHVSIININGNEAQDNTLRINLENVNDKPTTVGRVQLKPATTMQRKKPAPPVPTNQLMAKVKTTDQIPTTTTTTIRSNTNKQHNKSRTNAQPFATANQNANHYKCTADIAVAHIDDASHDFLRGSTLSQSFVHQTKRQQKIKGKAPQPPQLPHTTFMPYGNSNNISNSTHCRISLANPFRHVLRFKSFDLLK